MVKPPEELGSQRWNVAKTIASETISAVSSVADSESPSRSEIDTRQLYNEILDLRSELDYWPFDDTEEAFAAVAIKAEFDDGPDGVNELGRYVSDRLVGEADHIVSIERDESPDLNVGRPNSAGTSGENQINSSENGHTDNSTSDGIETDAGTGESEPSENENSDVIPPEELGSQRWNVARQIASDVVTAVLEIAETENDSVSRSDIDTQELQEVVKSQRSKQDYWPFDGADELLDAVEVKAGFSDGLDGVNELGRYVSARLVDEVDRVTPPDSDNSTSDGQASTQSKQTEESELEQDVDSDLDTQTGTSRVSGDSDTEYSDREDTDDSVRRVVVGDGSVTFQIATDLYYCFLEDDDKFTEITDRYDTKFPSRSILLTDVINTSGSVEERIIKLEQYVDEWYQDDDAVERLEKFKRKPMGA